MQGDIADIDLFYRIQADDAPAYEVLFDRHWHALFQFAFKLLRSREEAKDVTQTIFLYLWEKRKQISIKESVQSYLFQAVRYRALNRLRELIDAPQDIEETHERLLPVFNDILQSIEYDELLQIVENHVNALPDRTREIFRLSRYNQLTIEEIGQQLGLSEQTVKNQLSNALKILRQGVVLEVLMICLKIC